MRRQDSGKSLLEVATRIVFGSDALNEVITIPELWELLVQNIGVKKGTELCSLWGVAPIAPFHLGYDRLICKQRDLLQAGFHHKIVIADVHAYLGSPNEPRDEYEARARYYKACLEDLADLHGADFTLGSSFQYSPEYVSLLYDALGRSKLEPSKKAIPLEAQADSPVVSQIVYPAMQSIDLAFLSAQIAFGEMGQRRVYVYARELLPKIGFSKPVILLSGVSRDIRGGPLAKSTSKTRITLHESPDTLELKLKKMYAPPRTKANNPLLELCEFSVWPYADGEEVEVVTRNSGVIKVKTFEEVRDLYTKDVVTPQDLKRFAFENLVERLQRCRDYFSKTPELVRWIDFDRMGL